MSAHFSPVPTDEFSPGLLRRSSQTLDVGRESLESVRSNNPTERDYNDARPPVLNVARHTVGILLLLVTVVLWTASNFLASVWDQTCALLNQTNTDSLTDDIRR